MLCIATQYTPSVQRTAVFIIDIMMSLYKVAALAALLALLLSASFSSALRGDSDVDVDSDIDVEVETEQDVAVSNAAVSEQQLESETVSEAAAVASGPLPPRGWAGDINKVPAGMEWYGTHKLEQPPASEAPLIQQVQSLFEMFLKQAERSKDWLRQAHTKQHGCLQAQLTVANNIPAPLNVGVFGAAGKTYNAMIRFSNGAGKGFTRHLEDFNTEPDFLPDNRGLALKLFDVTGDKPFIYDQRNASTQDFMFTSAATPFVDNAAEALQYFQAVNRGQLELTKFLVKHPKIGIDFTKGAASGVVKSLLTTKFWGNMPVAFGADAAAKIELKPCNSNEFVLTAPSVDYFRHNLQAQLQSKSACYSMVARLYSDPKNTPVEQATQEWTVPNKVRIAILTIPAQPIDIDEGFCRDASFNSWHALAVHQPLGGIQRIRRAVYTNIARARTQFVKKEYREPTWADVQAARRTLNGKSLAPAIGLLEQQDARAHPYRGNQPISAAWTHELRLRARKLRN